jgi:hypothetical protein
MRLKTTEIQIGARYVYRRSWLDDVNRLIYPTYPFKGSWVVPGDDGSYVSSAPPSGTALTVTAEEVGHIDRKGRKRVPKNYRGRPFVMAQGDDGRSYVPVDPQFLYPIGTAESRRTNALWMLFWVVGIPIAVGMPLLGAMLLFDPGDSWAADDAARIGRILLVAGTAVALVAGWVLWRTFGALRREGTLKASLKTGLVVGAAIAGAELLRAVLGWP